MFLCTAFQTYGYCINDAKTIFTWRYNLDISFAMLDYLFLSNGDRMTEINSDIYLLAATVWRKQIQFHKGHKMVDKKVKEKKKNYRLIKIKNRSWMGNEMATSRFKHSDLKRHCPHTEIYRFSPVKEKEWRWEQSQLLFQDKGTRHWENKLTDNI